MKAHITPLAFLKVTRMYHVVMKRPGMPDDCVDIQAKNRREAVTKTLNWFWYAYYGSMGPAHKALTINDPYREVVYGPKFVCNARGNKLLDEATITRVIKESKGELERDTRIGRPHFPPGSVKRIKRRRDFGKFVAPCIRRMKNGTMYYRVTTRTQRSGGGELIRKRAYRDIRLEAKTLEGAVTEVRDKKLNKLNKSRRKMKVRRLVALRHIAGVTHIHRQTRKKYQHVLSRYELPVRIAIPA